MWRLCLLLVGMLALISSSPWTFAQAVDRAYRLGILSPSAGVIANHRAFLFPELGKLGFFEGKNLTIDVRVGRIDQLPSLARELASTYPEVVIAVGAAAIRAMRGEAGNIPVVAAFIGEDPVAAGFADSLAHPGGAITGIVMLAPELDAKRLQLLHEVLPAGRKIAALAVDAKRDAPNIAAVIEAADRAGIEVLPFYADTRDDYPAAFAEMHAAGVDGLQIVSAPELFSDAALLASRRTPGWLDQHGFAAPISLRPEILNANGQLRERL